MSESIKLTSYSQTGCGCKIAPGVLHEMLSCMTKAIYPNLIVGNDTKDDAAVVDLGDGTGIVSTCWTFFAVETHILVELQQMLFQMYTQWEVSL